MLNDRDREVTVIETESGSGLKWFLLGAAIGAGLGVLFAPQAGERTRRDLAKRGRKIRARAEETIGDFAEEVESRGRKIKESVEEFAEDVMDEVKETKRKSERAGSTAREEMERRLADARARARATVGADGADEEDDEAD